MSRLQGVADTLFIPLTARVYASRRFPGYFYDEKALALEPYIPGDSIRKKSSEYALMASVARYYSMDAMVKAFIAQRGRCNVAYLGAGLETAYYRLNEPRAMFYEVDLPGVIAARRAVLGEGGNEILIGGDLFDLAWAAGVDKALPTLLVVSGVFQYFTQARVLRFVRDAGDAFGRAELLFDATNETGIRYANRYVQKTGNRGALMHFYVNDGAAFAQEAGAALLEERVFFTDARRLLKRKLNLYTRLAMRVVDEKKRAVLLHLRLAPASSS